MVMSMKKVKFYKSFRARVFALNILIILVIMYITSFGVIDNVRKDVEQRVFKNTMSMTNVFKDNLETQINDLKITMKIIASTDGIRSMEFQGMDRILKETVELDPIISQMYVMDQDGYQFYKTSFLETLGDRSDREYFKRAIRGETFLSDVIISRSTKQPIAVIAVPVKDVNNDVVGVLGASIELGFLSEMAKTMITGDDGYGYIVDRKGVLIAHPNFEYVQNMKDLSNLQPVANVKNGLSGFGDYEFEGVDKLVSYLPIKENNWGLLVQLPKESAFSEIETSIRNMRYVYFVGILISVLMMIPFSKYVMNPIKETVRVLKSIENKDYEIEFDHPRSDEFGIIQERIEMMAQKIQKDQEELEDKVRERTFELNEANLELQIKIEEVETARSQVNMANQELEATLEDLKSTQKRLVESEKIASLSSFAAQFSHKINTPIGTIVTASSFLTQKTLEMEDMVKDKKVSYRDYQTYIKSVKETADIIEIKGEEAKAFLRGFKEITLDNVYGEEKNINVCEEIEEALRIAIDSRKIEDIRYAVNCEGDIRYHTQKGALYTVIFQLISNAKEHAKVQGKDLNLIANIFRDDRYINIEFEDDGKGIAKEDQEKIFEPFYKGDLSKENMGIGLSLVYNIITKIFDGEIIFESSPSGTKFKIFIPVK